MACYFFHLAIQAIAYYIYNVYTNTMFPQPSYKELKGKVG